MKRCLLLAAFLVAISCQLFSQAKPYNVVFDITTDDSSTHQRVIRWIKLILESNPEAKLEVVIYGKSLPMVETEKSAVAVELKKLAAGYHVSFVACEHAMQVFKVDKSMLIPGVKTVPDGIYELVSKQAEGFGYIKVVN